MTEIVWILSDIIKRCERKLIILVLHFKYNFSECFLRVIFTISLYIGITNISTMLCNFILLETHNQHVRQLAILCIYLKDF